MDWNSDMSAAPIDRTVKVGRWRRGWVGEANDVWETDFAVVRTGWFFGLFAETTCNGRFYTHWQPVPPPPTTINEKERGE